MKTALAGAWFFNLASIYLDNRFLSLNDERFVDDLLTDLSEYLERNDPNRVLLFPPLNGYNRLLIHKTVESEFSDLVTFSIGAGVSRRTVVAFRIACTRGPRGIQMMNNTGSPLPRGRGRGKQKEMSASERVTHWVNQREAKRLNKERWSSRGSGENSHTADEKHEDDSQIEELESGCDKYAAKRLNVQLYVPPFLRTKKESETKNDLLDLEEKNSACKTTDNEDVYQKSETVCKIGTNEESVDKKQTCEIRTKQRGRGRRKPEVEIYVPRALRTAKNESKSISEQTGSGTKNLSTETHEKTESMHCDINLDTDILASNSLQASPFSKELHNYAVHNDISHQELKPYSKNESSVQCDIDNSQTILTNDLTTKKVKYELTVDSEHPSTSASDSTTLQTSSNEQSHLNKVAGNSLTFEFYDPAVIAFLPSSVYVPYNTNTSYSMEMSRQDMIKSYPINENGIECLLLPVSADPQPQIQHVTNDSQPLLFTIHDKETGEEGLHGKMKTEDVSIKEGNEHFTIEPLSVTKPQESSVMEDFNGSNTVQYDSLKPTNFEPDISMSECITDIGMSENLMAGRADFSTGGLSQNVFRYNATDISVSAYIVNVDEDPVIGGTDLSVSGLSPKDIHSTTYQVTQNSSDELDLPEDGSDKQFLNSKINKSDIRQTNTVSNDHIQEEGDTWDSLFDDNGDCLDDALIAELEEYVGKVEIDKPRINYLKYEPKEPEMDFEGFSHILEIYDFSPDLATCDLISAFREFSSRGFDVKWVDDTHALGIFSSSVAANEALQMIHPLLKLRPLSEASKKGQSKARHCQEFLQPYKARPETTSIAARRLVAGALGMSTPQVSKEVRERERQKLKEAKEKRRQERQQKVDVWDGSFGKCAMDEN